MERLWIRRRPYRIALAATVVVLGAMGFLPLFGGPSYEAALGTGLVIPALAAASTAIDVAEDRAAAFTAIARGLFTGFVLGVAALVTVFAHGLRVGFCDPWPDVQLWLLGPGAGGLMGGAWGAAAGFAVAPLERHRLRRVAALAVAVLGPLGGIAVSIGRFYTSPMVFAFDPFFGFFAGPIYDTVIQPIDQLVTYRLGSLGTLGAALVLALHVDRSSSGRPVFRWRRQPGLAVLGAASAVVSAYVWLDGPAFGHYSSAASIQKALGQRLAGERCDVVYSSSIQTRDARVLADECDAWVPAVERYLETRGPDRILVYLFASPAEKGRLMGAATTYIAKPWRREIYLQTALYPHPTLGHELAHVIAGSFAHGPFLVSGPLGGWWPDPGRIEGVAVAAAPPEDEDLTLEEWSRAMLDMNILPPLASVFRLGFLGQNPAAAYTVAGAFVSFVHDTHGAGAIKRWYAGESIESITGKRLDALERDWHASLSRLGISPAALVTAKARFERPSIFRRSCPHVVDAFAGAAGQRLGAGDVTGAREAFERVLALDPTDFGARMGLAACARKAGDLPAARALYSAIAADPRRHRLERANAVETLADLALYQGNLEAARAGYDEVASLVVDEDRLRALDVKRNPGSDVGRRAIVSLLIGDAKLGASWDVAAAQLGEWLGGDPNQGLAPYLLGKNLYGRGRWDDAAAYLDRALVQPIALDRVLDEALRVRFYIACAERRTDVAASVHARLAARPTLNAARRRALDAQARRCGISLPRP